MSELANYFATKRNIEVHLILYGITREIFYSVSENIVIHKPLFRFDNRFRLVSTLRTMKYLRSTIKRLSPSAVLSFGEYWNSLVLLSIIGIPSPIYVSDRCSPDKSLGFFHDSLRKVLYRYADGIIAQTYQAKIFYENLFSGKKVAVIGNPIRGILSDSNIQKENIILTVGRLIPTKNHSKLIDSFLRLNESNWKLVIVGGDALRLNLFHELKAKIHDLKADDLIILTGNVHNVDKYYQKSKIFVMTSESEGFPNVIGEAMSAGIPVVAFDCSAGPSDMIDDSVNGFLVGLHNYKLLEARLLLLMNNEALRNEMGVAAKESIKRFYIENIGEQYLSLITGKHESTSN